MPVAHLLLRILTDPDPLPPLRKSPEQVAELIRQEGAGEQILSMGLPVPDADENLEHRMP